MKQLKLIILNKTNLLFVRLLLSQPASQPTPLPMLLLPEEQVEEIQVLESIYGDSFSRNKEERGECVVAH
jgi:hypothetical protein